MGKKILRKLNSQTGASISFALVAFIVATMVSLVIVAAALTNAIKIRNERANEQAYLIAQSVANALSDQIVSTVYESGAGEDGKDTTNRYVEIRKIDDGVNPVTYVVDSPTEGTTAQIFSEPLKSMLEETSYARFGVVNAATAHTAINKTDNKTVKVTVSEVVEQSGSGAKLSDDVVAKLNNDTTIVCYMPKIKAEDFNGALYSDNYDLDFLITVPTYGTRSYTCILHLDAKITGSADDLYIYWPTAKLVKGDGTE